MSRPAKKSKSSSFTPAIRRNWGYWDGIAARKAGRWPAWCRPHQDFAKVHFDKAYGEGFYIGWYGLTPPPGAII